MLAIIIPTDKCNLRCRHCMRSAYTDFDLEIDVLRTFLSGMKEYRKGNYFSITGGEPTLHSNLSGLLTMLSGFGFLGRVMTNGQNEVGIRILANFPKTLDYVGFSLEGPSADINDQVRGRGSFGRAVRAIEIIKKSGIRVYVRTTLNSNNVSYVKEMFSFADEYRVDFLGFSTIQPCINSESNNLLADSIALEKAFEEYKNMYSKYPKIRADFCTRHFKKFTGPGWPNLNCRPISKQHGEIVLKPNGDVSFCCDLSDFNFSCERVREENDKKFDHFLGNVKKDNFGTILKRRNEMINNLTSRRRADAASGVLKDARQYICENCKFYFYGK